MPTDLFVGERQDGTKEPPNRAESNKAARSVGGTPPCQHRRTPRLVQTAGGHGATPSFHSALGNRQSSCHHFSWPPVRCAARLVFLWGADAREDRLLVPMGGLAYDTGGELMRTSVTHQRTGLRWCRGEHATTGADQTPGPRPVTLSRRAARCWPSAGLRGQQRECRRMFSGLWVVACHCGCTQGRGSLSRPALLSRFLVEPAVTPAVHLTGLLH